MKHFMRSAAMTAVALLALIVASCSPETDDLLSTVPAGTDFVAVVDAHAIAGKLGVTVKDGSLQLPAEWQQAFSRVSDEKWQTAAKAAEAIDMTRIVMFYDNGESPITTFRITDKGIFDELMGSSPAEKKNGFKCYENALGTIMVSGNQGWLAKGSDPTPALKRILSNADSPEGSIADITALRQSLELDKPVRVVYDKNMYDKKSEGLWCVGYADLSDSEISLVTNTIDREGRTVSDKTLRPVNTDFLRYTPANCNFAFAVGVTPEHDWSTLESIASLIPDPQVSGMMGTIMPYLKKADGTVAVAADINTADIGASGATFLTMIHMPQADVDAALLEIEQRMIDAGASPVRSAGNIISIPGLYAGNVDGYLAVSSVPLTPTYQNSLNSYFLNRRMGFVVSLPSVPMFGTPFGVTVSFDDQTEKQEGFIRTTVPLKNAIAVFLEMMI